MKKTLKSVKNDIQNKAASATGSSSFSMEGVKGVISDFYKSIDIKTENWDQLLPYRFVVIDTSKGNSIVGGTYGPKNITDLVRVSRGQTSINFESLPGKWEFILPISPQQLTIGDQFAINTSATLKGVLEEHNGVKFKNISVSGTMGILPQRPSVASVSESDGWINSVFAGTIGGVANVGRFGDGIQNILNNKHPASKPYTPKSDEVGMPGYYLAQAFQQFLEQYAEAKKDPANYAWRLVLDIPKQNQSLVVTPLQFVWSQSENKPDLVNYTLQLKAWRRIDLEKNTFTDLDSTFKLTPNVLQKALNVITEARKMMSAATTLIGAVRSDVERPLDVLRQTALFIKDLVGVTVKAADLPFQIQQDYKSSIKESMNIMKDSIKSTNSSPKVRDILNKIGVSTETNEGLTIDNINSGQLGPQAKLNQQIDPSNNIFEDPAANFEIFNEIDISDLNLTNTQQAVVSDIIESSGSLSVDNLREFRKTLLDLALQLSDYFGAGDSYFSNVYNRPTPKTRLQPMTLDEYALLKSIYDSIQAYDTLTATTTIDDLDIETNMDFVSSMASESEIEFQDSTSKILVPVPFGLTMEQIAARYLKDPMRWLEIATLNNLREPYIDEDGFSRPLLSNGSGRNITISNDENLYVGQKISIRSSMTPPSFRTILDIKRLSDTSFLITLDGLPNLDQFTLADKAYVQGYLPGTTNSQQKIFIPTDMPIDSDVNIIPPAISSKDALTGLSKVDWLLDESGDVAVNNFGDVRLAYGMTNLIQALKIKIGTVKGTNLLHPDFGLGIKVGGSISDIDLANIYGSLDKLISQDSRFNGLSSLSIELNGSAIILDMGVQLAAQRGVFPIRFELTN
jgi:hypothetical protein